MGWLRNLLVFPDDAWEFATGELGGDFVRGKWLANSEMRLVHRDVSVTLGVHFSTSSKSNTQFTKAVPDVSLHPEIQLLLYPRMRGIMGSLTTGLLSNTGKTIDLPVLGEDYQVIGNNADLASKLFGHPDFVSTLKDNPIEPTVAVGGELSSWGNDRSEDDEEDLYVSVPRVLKEVHDLIAMISLVKVLLDLLEENSCLT